MNKKFYLHASNQMEQLVELLKKALFEESRPFTKRLLVVPSPIMRAWILWKLASDPKLSVAMGIEMTYLIQALSKLTTLFPSSQKGLSPSQLEMALAIEHEIDEILNQESGSPIWQPLESYLSPSSSLKKSRRLTQLSIELAQLFTQYGLYAGLMIQSWNEQGPKDWQEALFLKLYQKYSNWTTPCEELTGYLFQTPKEKDMQVHLFGLNFISPLHHRFFECVSQAVPVHYYLLSPCEHYWGDLTSDAELRHIRKQWRKEGIDEEKQQELEEYFQDRHILLANLGKLGRKMMLQIDDCSDQGQVLHQENPNKTLLARLQNEMLTLENLENNEGETDSIQIHIAPTKYREVEILYNNILHLIEKHQYHPNDFIVMAPDITDYVPYIKSVFNDPNRPVNFQIYDLKMSSQSSVVQSFQSLLQLAKGRLDAISLIQFFELPEVMKRHGLSKNDAAQFRQWVMETKIRWGSDVHHRNELLQQGKLGEKHQTGTWEYGLRRLLFGLAFDSEENIEPAPYEAIEMAEAPLLGKLISLIRALREDLRPCSDNARLSLHQWSTYLKCLYEAYFQIDKQNDEAVKEEQQLFSMLDRLQSHASFESKTQFCWNTINTHCQKMFSEQSMNFRESHVQAVKFCSMLPMRAIPSKVVALIGMEEGIFPKNEIKSPLDKTRNSTQADYIPSTKDFDRYLFLEALLSARAYFLMSVALESSEKKPSLLLSEMQSVYPEIKIVKHPFSSYHKAYFKQEKDLHNYRKQDYEAAKALQNLKQKPRHFISDLFSFESRSQTPDLTLVTLNQLFSSVKNPLKIYYNQSLGIYLQEEKVLTGEDQFVLNPLEEYQLKTDALTQDIEEVMTKAESKGQLPQGLFKEHSIQKMKGEGKKLKDFLKDQGILEEDLLTIELNEHCNHPIQIDQKTWHVPAIAIDGTAIVGNLNWISQKGLCLYQSDEPYELFTAWPKILVVNYLSDILKDRLSIEKRLIFLKSKNTMDCEVQKLSVWLKKFLDYYKHCLSEPSPLIPEWIQDLMQDKNIEETMNQNMQNPFKKSFNLYLLWSLRDQQVDQVDHKYIELWKERALSSIDFEHEIFSKMKWQK